MSRPLIDRETATEFAARVEGFLTGVGAPERVRDNFAVLARDFFSRARRGGRGRAMTDHLISPDYTFSIAGRTFAPPGTFAALKAVQHAFAEDLLPLQARVIRMRVDEVAKLLAVAAGVPEDEAGQFILDAVDITGPQYQLLKAHLMAWLAVAMAPKADREARVTAMGELIGKLGTPPAASRGGSIRNSPSASSAGRPPRSGRRPSGNSPTPGAGTPAPGAS